jgi:diguanylate cyclase (GGDEF)-like protein
VRGGLHAAWSRLGWPRTYKGKLWLGALLVSSLPALAALAWQLWGGGTHLSLWLLAGMALAALLAAVLAHGLASPLEVAASSLRRTEEAEESDVGALLARRVPALAQQATAGSAAMGSVAGIDPATGLPNQHLALERLRHCLAMATREGRPLAAALVSIDGMEEIQQRWGPASADRVLDAVSRRLEQLLRGSDWAARWDGDRFLAVLFSDLDGTRTALERVREDVSATRIVTDHYEIQCSVSLGASLAQPQDHLHDWLRRVESQLERARNVGPRGMALDG